MGIHVSPHSGLWRIYRAGYCMTIASMQNEAEAVASAKEIAKSERAAFYRHDYTGRIVERIYFWSEVQNDQSN